MSVLSSTDIFPEQLTTDLIADHRQTLLRLHQKGCLLEHWLRLEFPNASQPCIIITSYKWGRREVTREAGRTAPGDRNPDARDIYSLLDFEYDCRGRAANPE